MKCNECDKKAIARGLCQKHYDAAKWRGELPPTVREFQEPRCGIPDCTNNSKGYGLCQTHLQRKNAGWPDWDTRPVNKKLRRSEIPQFAGDWEYLLWRNYNMLPGDYEKKLAEQNGGCAICKKPCHTGRRLSVDHDHKCCPGKTSCGKCVRGLLCHNCNTVLTDHLLRIWGLIPAYLENPPAYNLLR